MAEIEQGWQQLTRGGGVGLAVAYQGWGSSAGYGVLMMGEQGGLWCTRGGGVGLAMVYLGWWSGLWYNKGWGVGRAMLYYGLGRRRKMAFQGCNGGVGWAMLHQGWGSRVGYDVLRVGEQGEQQPTRGGGVGRER